MIYDLIDSPIGALTVSTDGVAITGLHIPGDRYFFEVPRGWSRDSGHALLAQAARELDNYFSGRSPDFGVPLAPAGTDFQRLVWKALGDIGYGSTATYGSIAQKIGRPAAVRAVGTAIGHNPICLFIPCHRVLQTGGGPGGFVAGLEIKKRLLELESFNRDKSSFLA